MHILLSSSSKQESNESPTLAFDLLFLSILCLSLTKYQWIKISIKNPLFFNIRFYKKCMVLNAIIRITERKQNVYFVAFFGQYICSLIKDALKILIAIGISVILGLLVLMILYFRKAVFVLLIPLVVTLFTAFGVVKQEKQFIWPIVGISFFHIFLDLYILLIFSFFFLFKPLYIIMVLNWAFDTMYTAKTPSYYASCAAVYITLALFMTFNILQLKISLKFHDYLEHLSNTCSVSSSCESTTNGRSKSKELKRISSPSQSNNYACRMLNEPPTISINKVLMSGGTLDGKRVQ